MKLFALLVSVCCCDATKIVMFVTTLSRSVLMHDARVAQTLQEAGNEVFLYVPQIRSMIDFMVSSWICELLVQNHTRSSCLHTYASRRLSRALANVPKCERCLSACKWKNTLRSFTKRASPILWQFLAISGSTSYSSRLVTVGSNFKVLFCPNQIIFNPKATSNPSPTHLITSMPVVITSRFSERIVHFATTNQAAVCLRII